MVAILGALVSDLRSWFPLIIAILGIGGTLLASWIGYRNSMRMERARWAREDRLRQEHVERETRDRYNLERIRVYTEFLGTGSLVLAGPPPLQRGGNTEQRAAFEAASTEKYWTYLSDFRRAYFATRLLATPAVSQAAADLHEAIISRRSEARPREAIELAPSSQLLAAFRRAAQSELGVPLEPPAPHARSS